MNLPLTEVDLPDGSRWLRIGDGVMVRLGRETTQTPPAKSPPGGGHQRTADSASTQEAAAPTARPPRKGKSWSRRPVDEQLLVRAQRLVEDEGRQLKEAGAAIGVAPNTLIRYAKRLRWVTSRKANRLQQLVAVKGYSVKRAAAAVDVPLDRAEAVLDRLGTTPAGQSDRRADGPRSPKPERTPAERCPHCKRSVTTNPCHYCLERR